MKGDIYELLISGSNHWNAWREKETKDEIIDISKLQFDHCNLAATDLSDVVCKRSVFIGANLAGANLNGADGEKSIFKEAYLRGATIQEAQFNGSNFSRTRLQDADLRDSSFVRSDFSGSNARDSNFAGATLRSADLSKSNLRNADLSRTSLQGAILKGANLRDANLSGAILFDADLSAISESDLSQEQLEQALGNAATKLPSHLRRPEAWKGKSLNKENLISPTSIVFDFKKYEIVRSSPQTSLAESHAEFRDELVADQCEATRDLIQILTASNTILPRFFVDQLRKYENECSRGPNDLAPIKLERLFKITNKAIRNENPEQFPTGFQEAWSVFAEHHGQLESCYTLIYSFRQQALFSQAPSSGIPADQQENLRSAIENEVISPDVRDDIQTELALPDQNEIGRSNDEKSLGLAAYALRLKKLADSALKKAEKSAKKFESVEKLLSKLGKFIRWIAENWSNLLDN